ncbi:MAG: Mur ligase family protein [Planctomycetota bacterium]
MTIDVGESRQLLGPNLLWNRPGAGTDVYGPDRELDAFVRLWQKEGRRWLDALGWTHEDLAVRRFPGQACLAISAPIDGTHLASEVHRLLTLAALRLARGEQPSDTESRFENLARLVEQERNPALRELRAAAVRYEVGFLVDEESVTVGQGSGSLTFPIDGVPDPGAIDWAEIHDIPVVIITGTHGKTSVARLLRRIVEAAELEVGMDTGEEVVVSGELLQSGEDPSAASALRVLRDNRIDVAILEVPRAGLCERGLPIEHASAALVTRIASRGVPAEEVVSRVLHEDSLLILNADSAIDVVPAGVPNAWFGLDPAVRDHLGDECRTSGLWLEDGQLIWRHDGMVENVMPVSHIPSCLGGAAEHQIANVMGAVLAAGQLSISVSDIVHGLESFGANPLDNPGRIELRQKGDLRVLIDAAHDEVSLSALERTAGRVDATRRLWVLGAPLSDDAEERGRTLSRAAELGDWLGIAAGSSGLDPEVVEQLSCADIHLGLDPSSVARVALQEAKPGDLLILTGDRSAAADYRELVDPIEEA